MPAGDKKPKPPAMGSQKAEKARHNEEEKNLADRLGGRRQPNSGALDGHKGDVKLDHFLLDRKETKANSIIIDGRDLTKITREADGEGKEPGLVLVMGGKLPSTVSREWVTIPLETFARMLANGQDSEL